MRNEADNAKGETMTLFTKAQKAQLVKNWQAGEGSAEGEPPTPLKPVIKLFTPWGGATWLLTELCERDGVLYGLCDLGLGFPELGYVSVAELEALQGPYGLRVERDLYFTASKTLAEYAAEASTAGRIAA
jgi:hypothetical protein